ncbi:MAG: tetratricopeptide repeat protein, partial [Pseudomonadota bacterium]|nr:tetratricopeptide repeat protein [Pseudomonadota bacterium]
VLAEVELSRNKPTGNLEAYDLMLRALPGLMPGTSKAQKDETSSLIDRALEMDPDFSLAKAWGSFVCMQRLGDGQGDADDVKAGLRYAEGALANHRDNPLTLALSGLALASIGYRVPGGPVLGFRYDEALRAIGRALSLSPNLFVVSFAAGSVHAYVGEGDAAITHLERAMRLSPLDPGMGALIVAISLAHLVSGRYEEAATAAHRAIQMAPTFSVAYRLAAVALANLGRVDEAHQLAQRMLELVPGFTVSRYASVSPIRSPEYRNRSAELLRAAGIPN